MNLRSMRTLSLFRRLSALLQPSWRARAACVLAICVLAIVTGLASVPVRAEDREKRVALLIQNDLYPDAEPSKTADDDGATLAASLKRDGFDVQLVKNVGKQSMRAAIDGFVSRVTAKSVALVYFKGIGLEASRLTYLVPVDAAIWSEADVRREGTSLDRLLAGLDRRGATVKIAIVDAARPNPFERRFRMVSAGLAPPSTPKGALVMFSQALHKVADPGSGGFVRELVQQMQAAPDAESAFARTRDAVSAASKGREVPWVSSTLGVPFYFGPTPPPGIVLSPTVAIPTKPPETASATPSPPVAPPPKPAPASLPAKPPASHETQAATPQAAPSASPMPPTPTVPPKRPDVATTTPTPPVAPPTTPAPVAPPQLPPSAVASIKPEQAAPSPKPAALPPSQKPAPQKPVAAEPRPGVAFSDCPHCPEMIVLPAATFQMGSGTTPYDRPVHKVTIGRPFALGRSVVTRDEWRHCVEDGGCTLRPDGKDEAAGTRPMAGLAWSDARQYVDWLSRKTGKAYRLPSEAEWEYAARGGTTTTFAWGDAVGVGHANCTDCGNKSGRQEVEPARTYPANGFGLFDMGGNVAEWLQDCWTLTYRDAPADGAAVPDTGCKMRVLRGGSFATSSAYVKPTARFRDVADTRSPSNGFRVARDLK